MGKIPIIRLTGATEIFVKGGIIMWWIAIIAFIIGFFAGFILVGMFTASKRANAISDVYAMLNKPNTEIEQK